MRQLTPAVDAVTNEAFEQFDTLVDPSGGPLALAVSGGSDSTALLLLASDWAKRSHQALICFTVDHGLRPEAAGEASRVADLALALGIPHKILKWTGGRPVQAAARRARHALLAQAARRVGATQIAFGHTLDDQIETILMRTRQGSTWYGLGGMDRAAPSPVWPEGRGIGVIRPLLGARRQDLRDALRERGQAWVDEPSNADAAFERVRMRDWIASAPALQPRLERLADRLGQLRRAQNRGLALSLACRVIARADGTLALNAGGLSASALARLLPTLIQIAAGHADPVSGAAVSRLAENTVSGGLTGAVTLGGAWIGPLPDGRILFARDPGLVPTHGQLVSGLWDGRFAPGGLAHPDAEHAMARPGLPSAAAGWRAICSDRIEHLCTFWGQSSPVLQ